VCWVGLSCPSAIPRRTLGYDAIRPSLCTLRKHPFLPQSTAQLPQKQYNGPSACYGAFSRRNMNGTRQAAKIPVTHSLPRASVATALTTIHQQASGERSGTSSPHPAGRTRRTMRHHFGGACLTKGFRDDQHCLRSGLVMLVVDRDRQRIVRPALGNYRLVILRSPFPGMRHCT
jgi:hypothetical protein